MMKKIWGAIATMLGIALLLLGIGALVGNSWAEDQVKGQLSQEKITMPDDAGIAKIEDSGCRDQLNEYKGQKLENGDQAKVYADCYIKQHMMASSKGKTYSEVSGEAMKDKNNADLQAQRQNLFMGDTLRGMLLNAYAWWTFAKIAFWVGLGSLILGIPLLLLGLYLLTRKHHHDTVTTHPVTTHPVETRTVTTRPATTTVHDDGQGASAV